MASFNASLVHLPLVNKGLHILILLCFLASFCPKDGEIISLSCLAPLVVHFGSYEGHWSSWFKSPWSQPPTHWGCLI
jgi:hypothetical protein